MERFFTRLWVKRSGEKVLPLLPSQEHVFYRRTHQRQSLKRSKEGHLLGSTSPGSRGARHPPARRIVNTWSCFVGRVLVAPSSRRTKSPLPQLQLFPPALVTSQPSLKPQLLETTPD